MYFNTFKTYLLQDCYHSNVLYYHYNISIRVYNRSHKYKYTCQILTATIVVRAFFRTLPWTFTSDSSGPIPGWHSLSGRVLRPYPWDRSS